MKNIIILFIIAVSFYLSCHKNPVNGKNDIKNPRKLTWTADTLLYESEYDQTDMRSIWGSSANDVYVVGHNSGNRRMMYHYNGKKWEDVKLNTYFGGNIDGIRDLAAVYGFGSNDVWAAGYRDIFNPNPPPQYFEDISLVIHYNGSRWIDIPVPSGTWLFSIWGSSPDNIWMGGLEGTLLHYDGTSIHEATLPVKIDTNIYVNHFVHQIVGNSVNEAYLLLYAHNQNFNARRYLFEIQNNEWAVLDSSLFYEAREIWLSPNGTLYAYSIGNQVFTQQGNSWVDITSGQLNIAGVGDVYGTDDDNLFVVGCTTGAVTMGQAYHYNGVDWYEIKDVQLPNLAYSEVFTIGGEVFIIGITSETATKTIMLHGK